MTRLVFFFFKKKKSDSSLEIEAVGFAANSQIDNLQACVLRASEGGEKARKSLLAQHAGPAYPGQFGLPPVGVWATCYIL